MVLRKVYGIELGLMSFCLRKDAESETFFYNNTEMKNIKEEKILGALKANRLQKFKSHI